MTASQPTVEKRNFSSYSPIASHLVAGLVSVLAAFESPPVVAFDFNNVEQRAKQLASQSYKKPPDNLPAELKNLNYQQYRQIQYKPERVMWRADKLPFEVDFFAPGWHFQQPVKLHEVTAEGVRDIQFDPAAYDFGSIKLDPAKLRGLSLAGFRVRFPINAATRKDEVLSFLGASYFRALGKDQRYGLSARGLAIDTALPTGEEFPRFTEFWLLRPQASDKQLIIYGLLDSPRATGAYRFVLQPGVDTTMDVTAKLYLRGSVGKLGLAPLTSMYFFGPGQHPVKDDYRPGVYDSDGLSIHLGNDEWLWRPLTNPKRLLVTSFATTNPSGFGLMQRQRDFTSFQDPALRYELRPSAWVEAKGQWGAGRVELVQIPTPDETNDNIVAYWVPNQAPAPKLPYSFSYQIHWQKDQPVQPPLLWTAQTLYGRSYTHTPDDSIALAVDFVGNVPGVKPADLKPEAVVSVDANGKLLEQRLFYNDALDGWRMILRLQRVDADKPIELRAQLRNANKGISETWSYSLPPD